MNGMHNTPKSPIEGVIYGKHCFFRDTTEKAQINAYTEEYIKNCVNLINEGKSPLALETDPYCPECDETLSNSPFRDEHTVYAGYLLIGCEGYFLLAQPE